MLGWGAWCGQTVIIIHSFTEQVKGEHVPIHQEQHTEHIWGIFQHQVQLIGMHQCLPLIWGVCLWYEVIGGVKPIDVLGCLGNHCMHLHLGMYLHLGSARLTPVFEPRACESSIYGSDLLRDKSPAHSFVATCRTAKFMPIIYVKSRAFDALSSIEGGNLHNITWSVSICTYKELFSWVLIQCGSLWNLSLVQIHCAPNVLQFLNDIIWW